MRGDLSKLPDEWTGEQRALFLRLYRLLLENQPMVVHPRASPIPEEHWGTIAWNLAYLAADPPAEGCLLTLTTPESPDVAVMIEKEHTLQ